MKIQTQFSYQPKGHEYETSHEYPSETQPDQSYTIEELLARHIAGVLTDVQTPSFYPDDNPEFDDDDLEKAAKMDLYDIEHLMSERLKSKDEAEKTNLQTAENERTGFASTAGAEKPRNEGKSASEPEGSSPP